jgi:ABC-type multidrug transport system ATPase subunit
MRPTAGDALIYGHSILRPGGMDSARSLMGVCPQFDVLFPELTGLEHMLLFADIKGLPWKSRGAAAAQILERVGPWVLTGGQG